MKRCPPLSCSNPNVLPGDCCPQCPGKDVQDQKIIICCWTQHMYSRCIVKAYSSLFSMTFHHQLHLRTVCMNNNATDILSVSITQLTTVDHVPALMGQCTVSAGPAPLLDVLTPSHRNAAGPVKVKFLRSYQDTIKALCYLLQQKTSWSLTQMFFRIHLNQISHAGCQYEGRERANGETWDDASDPCAVCVCREGSVRCERRRCPPSNCKHPVQRQCCMSCDGEWLKTPNSKCPVKVI